MDGAKELVPGVRLAGVHMQSSVRVQLVWLVPFNNTLKVPAPQLMPLLYSTETLVAVQPAKAVSIQVKYG